MAIDLKIPAEPSGLDNRADQDPKRQSYGRDQDTLKTSETKMSDEELALAYAI